VHLFLIGWLIYRARYVNLPRIFGPLMALDALCLVIVTLQPYLYPQASVGWVFWIAFIELIFGWWLLFMGWRIRPSSVA